MNRDSNSIRMAFCCFVAVTLCPAFAQEARLVNAKMQTRAVDSSLEKEIQSLVNDQAGCFSEFFQHLLRAEGPLVFHCTAGKDRTGIIAYATMVFDESDKDCLMTK